MNKKSRSILSGKGFYAALALSVAMVGAACYFAYTQTSDNISGKLRSSVSTSDRSSEKAAAELQTDIPKVTIAPYTQDTVVTEAAQNTIAEPETEPETLPEEDSDIVEDSGEKSEEAEKPAEKTLSMPLTGEVLNGFSNGELVKSKTTGAWQTHNGADISAALGDAVLSAGAGTVAAVDNDPLWGITVTIDHGNGTITRYSNLNEGVTVQVGQEVGVGEEIGAVGETADIETSEKSHLHFEVIKNGSFTDPLDIAG